MSAQSQGQRQPHSTVLVELRRLAHAALAEAGALAFAVPCAGCGLPPLPLCEACRRDLRPEPRVRELRSGLRVWSGLELEGTAARVIRALKAEVRTPLAAHLAPALAVALEAAWDDALAVHAGADGAWGLGARAASGAVVIVPVPTSSASWRRRGVRVVELLARRAGARPARLLRYARRTEDQRGLGRAERGENLDGSMGCADARGLQIVLVDDVVTTGATLEEASRAALAAGGTVLGAATVASTSLLFDAWRTHT